MPPETVTELSNVFFVLEVDGVARGAFSDMTIVSELQGPTHIDDAADSPAGAERISATVALVRQQDEDAVMFAWHEAVVDGSINAARKNCSITVFSSSGTPVARYRIENAWPSRIQVGPVGVSPTGMLLESVTLMCDAVRRVAL
jgi:phage tail-like protein